MHTLHNIKKVNIEIHTDSRTTQNKSLKRKESRSFFTYCTQSSSVRNGCSPPWAQMNRLTKCAPFQNTLEKVVFQLLSGYNWLNITSQKYTRLGFSLVQSCRELSVSRLCAGFSAADKVLNKPSKAEALDKAF